jgi:hypothetical protein
VPGNASATVSWTRPSSDGGSPITGYTVVTYAGTTSTVVRTDTVGGDTRSLKVTDLVNGQTYSFTVAAANASGVGAPSPRSRTVRRAAAAAAPVFGTRSQVTGRPRSPGPGGARRWDHCQRGSPSRSTRVGQHPLKNVTVTAPASCRVTYCGTAPVSLRSARTLRRVRPGIPAVGSGLSCGPGPGHHPGDWSVDLQPAV